MGNEKREKREVEREIDKYRIFFPWMRIKGLFFYSGGESRERDGGSRLRDRNRIFFMKED